MRTYEVTMQVITYETVKVEHDGNVNHNELERKAREQLEERGIAGDKKFWRSVENIAARPKTDKQRFTDAFKELRSLHFTAKQNLTPYDDEVAECDILTLREDTNFAFEDGKLVGMMPVHWNSDKLSKTDVSVICYVFRRHGFEANWCGSKFKTIEVTGGEA